MKSSPSLLIGCALAFGFLFSACVHTPRQKEVRKLNPEELGALIANEKDLFFLDVRSSQEIQELGTLPGYVNIPIDQLEARIAEIPRGKTIVTA